MYAHKIFFSGLAITGKEAFSFIQSLITNDLKKVEGNKKIATIITNPKGKVKFLVYVEKIPDGYIFYIESQEVLSLKTFLDFFHIVEKIEIEVKEEFSMLYLLSRKQGEIPQTDYVENIIYDNPSFYCILKLEEIEKFLIQQNLQLIEEDLFENMRARYKILKREQDFSDRNLPQEAGFHHLISFTKGCFVGQEVISRLEHKGKVTKLICQLISSQPLNLDDSLKVGNQVIGKLTTVSNYPFNDMFYSLGFIKTSWLFQSDKKEFFIREQKVTVNHVE